MTGYRDTYGTVTSLINRLSRQQWQEAEDAALSRRESATCPECHGTGMVEHEDGDRSFCLCTREAFEIPETTDYRGRMLKGDAGIRCARCNARLLPDESTCWQCGTVQG